MQYGRPPRLGRFLVRMQPLGDRRSEIESDLLELFEQRVDGHGRRYASWRYVIDALSLWRMWSLAAVREGLVSVVPRPSWFAGAGADIVFAARLAAREPGSFGLAIAGLALAIGITSSVFSVLNIIAFRGYGVASPSTVVRLTPMEAGKPATPWRYADYRLLQDALSASRVTGVLRTGVAALALGERADGMPFEYPELGVISGNYFSLLGGQAAIGRTLADSDDLPGAPRVVVMSDVFWRTRFASDPSVVGRTMRLGGVPFTVIGVARRGFSGPRDIASPPAFWMAMTTFFEVRESDAAVKFNRHVAYLDVFTRVTSDLSAAQLESRATSIATARAAQFAATGAISSPSVRLTTLAELRSNPGERLIAALIIVILGLVLCVGCANVANVLLASAAGRRREIGARLALGASRARLTRQLLTESLLLGLLGALAGMPIALWLSPWLASMSEGPQLVDVSPDPIVFAFAALAGILCGLVAGMAPVRYGRRGDIVAVLHADSYGAAGSAAPSRIRAMFLGAQAAAAVVLLAITALIGRSFIQVVTLDPGFDPDRLVMSSELGSRYNAGTAAAFWDATIPQLLQVPGVTGAALARIAPFEGTVAPQSVPAARPGSRSASLIGESPRAVYRNEVSADYFAVLRANVLRGRTHTAEEARTGAPVAVISASLAQAFWGAEDPVGSSLTRVWGDDDRVGAPVTGLRKPAGTRVIGVVTDIPSTLRVEDTAAIYLPLHPQNTPNARLIVGVDGNPDAMSRPIRDVLRSMAPDLRPRLTPVRDLRSRELSSPRSMAILTALLGGSALILAVIGLFGVTAFVVRQRRHEISVRVALGASGHEVVRLMLRDALRPAMMGMAVGLCLAFVVGHLMRGALYGISGHDPVALAGAFFTLIVAVVAAALGPALRARRVDPAEMLKQS